MLVDKTQRVYAESVSNGVLYNLEMVQRQFATIADLADEVDDAATKIYILYLEGGSTQDITEQLAQAWIDERHEDEVLKSTDKKPAYVENSNALYEYADENEEDY